MKRSRRGASLVEMQLAIAVLAIATVGVGGLWVLVNKTMAKVREDQALARIFNRRVEDVRSIGPLYMPSRPSTGDPEVHHFDAYGRPLPGQSGSIYYTEAWTTYLPNDSRFTDGTANTVGATSLREIRVRIRRTQTQGLLLEGTTYVAAGNFGGAF